MAQGLLWGGRANLSPKRSDCESGTVGNFSKAVQLPRMALKVPFKVFQSFLLTDKVS